MHSADSEVVPALVITTHPFRGMPSPWWSGADVVRYSIACSFDLLLPNNCTQMRCPRKTDHHVLQFHSKRHQFHIAMQSVIMPFP